MSGLLGQFTRQASATRPERSQNVLTLSWPGLFSQNQAKQWRKKHRSPLCPCPSLRYQFQNPLTQCQPPPVLQIIAAEGVNLTGQAFAPSVIYEVSAGARKRFAQLNNLARSPHPHQHAFASCVCMCVCVCSRSLVNAAFQDLVSFSLAHLLCIRCLQSLHSQTHVVSLCQWREHAREHGCPHQTGAASRDS